MVNTEAVELVTAYECAECGEVSEDVEESPLYECGECGTKYNRDNSADGSSHRCPDCNKFGSKLATRHCAECSEGEVEEVERWRCNECETLHETEDEAVQCCPDESID